MRKIVAILVVIYDSLLVLYDVLEDYICKYLVILWYIFLVCIAVLYPMHKVYGR